MLKTTLVLEDQSRQNQNVEVMRAVMAKDRRFYNHCSVSLLLPHLQAQYV
jgi:hypothetical protein